MHTASRRFTILGLSTLSGVFLISGCASKGYVRTQTGAVDARVNQVATSVREQGERIDAVDSRAQQGITDARAAATAADTKATEAQTAAGGAQTAANAAQRSGYANPEVDRLIEEGRKSADPAKRNPHYQQAAKLIWDDHALPWIVDLSTVVGSRKTSTGWEYLPLEEIVVTNAEKA